VVAVRFLAAGTWRLGRPLRATTSVLADEAYAIAALRMPRGNCSSGTVRPPPPERSSSLQWSCRVVRRRAQPDVVPSAPVGSACRSVVGVVVPEGPRRPLGRAPGREQRA
jgi:hypothetical protein